MTQDLTLNIPAFICYVQVGGCVDHTFWGESLRLYG